jgi:hypothetical protein
VAGLAVHTPLFETHLAAFFVVGQHGGVVPVDLAVLDGQRAGPDEWMAVALFENTPLVIETLLSLPETTPLVPKPKTLTRSMMTVVLFKTRTRRCPGAPRR